MAAKAYGQAEALLRDEQFETSAAAAQEAVQAFEAMGAEGARPQRAQPWPWEVRLAWWMPCTSSSTPTARWP